GPEPWNAAYVQPSRRPKDGRYGENPNRLQHYYQYQVVLKPSPEDIQDRYLQSLVALGVNPKEHDIRFVEDDWESPTLGAWGLGWEVWLDGMEITQFTYFQEVGSLACKPVLRCSHTFNLLDARGAISVTERTAYIDRVRALARAVAKAYYESRERLGFPLAA